MKRSLIATTLAITLAVFPAAALVAETAADARQQKRDAINELLKVIDVKELTQLTFRQVMDRMSEMGAEEEAHLENVSPEERVKYKQQREAQVEKMRVFRDRLFTRIDYVKFGEEVYYPIFDKHYSLDEVKALTAFFSTKAGAKTARLLPELSNAGLMNGMKTLQELAQSIGEEMDNEENSKKPWRKTMADLRSVATALEARATDENEYPDVKSYQELEPLIVPTYIRTLPKTDSWGNPYIYAGSADKQHYRLVSGGADRKADWDSRSYHAVPENTPTRKMPSLDADIIFQDGTFLQAPEVAEEEQ